MYMVEQQKHFAASNLAHPTLIKLRNVEDMHQRMGCGWNAKRVCLRTHWITAKDYTVQSLCKGWQILERNVALE